jgi:hypothetical protein
LYYTAGQPAERERAVRLAEDLRRRGMAADTRAVPRTPQTALVRFYYEADTEHARVLADALGAASNAAGIPPRWSISDARGHPSPPRAGNLDVWLPASALPQSGNGLARASLSAAPGASDAPAPVTGRGDTAEPASSDRLRPSRVGGAGAAVGQPLSLLRQTGFESGPQEQSASGNASVAPEREQLSAAPPLPGGMRVFLHYPSGTPDAMEHAMRYAEGLRRRGVMVVDVRGVGQKVRAPLVRYFHESDLRSLPRVVDALSAVSAEVGGPPSWALSDFRTYAAPPQPGNIEVWLPGG